MNPSPQFQPVQPPPGSQVYRYPPHVRPARPASRIVIPLLTAGGGLILGAIIGAASAGGTAPSASPAAVPAASSGPQGYQVASALQAAMRAQVNKRLSNPSGQYYAPGVHVSSLNCVEQARTAATCLIKLSNGVTQSDTVAISADGDEYIAK